MNSSSSFGHGGDFISGFSNSIPNNSNFSFNAPSLERTSSRGVARPNHVKNRKQLNSRHLNASGNLERRHGPGFNLVRHASFSNDGDLGVHLDDQSSFLKLPNVGSFIERCVETGKSNNELLSKSNIKGREDVDDGTKKDFVFKAGEGSDSSVRSSTVALREGIKNLNIKGSGKESCEHSGNLGGKRDTTLSAEMGRKLNIGSVMGDSDEKLGDKPIHHEFTFQAATTKVHMDQPKTDIRPGGAAALTSSFLSSALPFQAGSKTFGMTSDELGKKDEFCFTAKQDDIRTPFFEFKTPNSQTIGAFGLNEKLEFSAKRDAGTSKKVNKKKGKLKQPKPVQLWHGPDFVLSKTSAQSSREPSVTSDECFSDSQPAVLSNVIDGDLVGVTHYLNSKEGGVKDEELKEESGCVFDKGVAAEYIDLNSDIAPSSAASSRTSIDRQDSDSHIYFGSFSDSEQINGFDFTFSASSSPQSQQSSPSRRLKKKNSAKFASFHLSPRQHSKPDVSAILSKVGGSSVVDKGSEVKCEPSITGSSTAALESCEKWRLRGNQAYANGDSSKAEQYYMQGISCIPAGEKSRSCLRALMLCYSNLAATRMSLGRMRDALGDCMMAISIDPNFLRVQLRAANCYLALGEVENAIRYFKKCLQSGTDVCVDRKVAVEASDGLQKAQKLSEYMHQFAVLLRSKTSEDAETALEVIAEALQISLFSEQFLEMKAEALLILGKYEDVVQLCVQTFDSAEKNSLSFDINGQPANPVSSGIKKDSTFRIWRCHLIFKSYFHLGKLEEAIAFLEKQEELHIATDRDGSNCLESSIPLAAIVRELLTHKAAGNEAFQLGRHLEAVEHYTAALSCNVESRPFAAICFCNRAAAYKALGQVTDAIADCSLAIALDRNYLKAISRRATLYEKIRDYGKATSDLERLLSLLMKQMEVKTNQTGLSERSKNLANDSRQARSWLSEIEEEGKKKVPLDFYLILGVESSVSTADIKKAYRKAALRHHPDKAVSLVRTENGDDKIWKEIREEAHRDADKLFKIIGEAYAVLSDPIKRSRYDSEEDTRNAQKKHTGRTSRASWKEARGSYGLSSSKESKATRSKSNRFF